MIRMLVALGCLTLAACAKSPVPITAVDGNKADDSLHGQWQYSLEGDPESIFIKGGENGELIATGEAPERGTGDYDFHVIVARLGGQHYASLYILAPPDKEPYPASYMLSRFEMRDADHFVLYGADPDLLMDAINRKLITGAAFDDRHLPGIELSASAEDLRAFIETHGARIFTAVAVEFTRVKQPAVRGTAAPETTPRRP